MAHEIELVDGKPAIVYVGDVPWHGLGVRVSEHMSPAEIRAVAQIDWTVAKHPACCVINDEVVDIGRSALVRSSDGRILDIVSDDWNPVQNDEAGDFFNEFVAAGDMEMHTAGSLKGGQIVWYLAKVKKSFELFKGDIIESYLLFSNFHKYGYSTDVRFTPTRVVCNNTLSMALGSTAERMVKVSHRQVFDPDNVKQLLGVADERLEYYKETAQFLGSKKAKDEDIVEYFTRIFPVSSASSKELSNKASKAIELLHTQPGAEFAEGTWWQPVNAVTYMVDHLNGRTADSRLTSAWYGQGKNLKNKAMELAIEMAEASA